MTPSFALKLTVPPMNETPKSTVTIKKYANRRLYNTATSTYVTLETLGAMVKEGIEFCVYDARTSEDITRSVLTQIIVEEEGKSGQQNLLPISFLRQLIGFYGANMQWLVPKYLEHSMDMLSNNQEQITNYFQTTFGSMFPFGASLEEMGKKNIEMFERTLRMFAPFVQPPSADDGQSGDSPEMAMKEEVKEEVVACSIAPAPAATAATASVTNINRRQEQVKPVVAAPEPATKTTAAAVAAPVEAVLPEPVMETIAENIAENKAPESVAPPEPSASPPAFAASAPVSSAPMSSSVPPSGASAPVTRAAAASSSTPMPNVQSITASATPTADDMQQKIANLQRQLADLAKNRA